MFYVTPISDISHHFFPENKISQFTTELRSAIYLNQGEWEVGSADIIYPHTCFNIREDNNVFGFDLGDGELQARKVPAGCYENVQDIVRAMTLTSHKNKIEFSYHLITKRVTIKTKD